MINNILIVGLGNMGMAHLSAFSGCSKQIRIYVLDKKKRLKLVRNSYKFNSKFKIIYLNKVPKNLIFSFVIVATDSKNRFKVTIEIIKKNKVKFLLLEKFMFLKIRDYREISKYLLKNQIKCYMNSWGLFLAKKIKNLNFNNKKISIIIHCNLNNYLTNIIHYILFFYKIKKDKDINFKKFVITKKIKSKYKNYKNISGFCEAISTDGSSLKVKTTKSNTHKIFFKINFKNKNLSININDKNKIIIESKKFSKIIDFPLAKNFTKKTYELSQRKNKIDFLPNYQLSEYFSKKILLNVKKIDKRLNIR
jgi:hypothetical protein